MESGSDICVCCNVRIAPRDPDRRSATVTGKRIVAHCACLHRYRLPPAVRLVSEQIEKHAGDMAPQCRLEMAQASGYVAKLRALRKVLKRIYFEGQSPVSARKRVVRMTARKLEGLLLENFTDCLDSPGSCG